MFRAAYETAWQHPGIAWIAGLLLLPIGIARLSSVSGRRGSRFWLWCFVVLELEILADAWLGGALAPKMTSFLPTVTMGFSIIFGDLRFFYLVELVGRESHSCSRGEKSWWRALRLALPVSCLIPGVTAYLHLHGPARFDGSFLYLVYELGALLVITSFCFIRARNPRAAARAYVYRLIVVECAQYVTWAIADVLILKGVDAGWLLRLVPNTIYYAAFVPLATFNTPRDP